MSELLHGVQPENQAVALDLYTGQEFFESLAKDLASIQAGDRVAITTMDFDIGDPLVSETFNELIAAADRGANVAFAVDAFAHMNPRKTIGPVVLPFGMNEETRRRRVEPLEELAKRETARCAVTNVPEGPVLNFFAGRSHLKIAVVNNRVYLGGPSFQGSDRIDMMVGMEDKMTADWMYDIATRVIDTANTKTALGAEDQTRHIDEHTQILLDAGEPNQSAILEEALKIIDEAEEWLTISSPFLLTGVTSDRLVKAHKRDVDVHIAYNDVSKYEQMRLVHRLLLAQAKVTKPAEFFAHKLPKELPALHAKVVASEKAGLLGSHNFVEAGVKFGTAEIALLREDPTFANAVRSLLLSQVQPAEAPAIALQPQAMSA